MPLKGQWSQAAARWEYRPEARSARSSRRRHRVSLAIRAGVIVGTLALGFWLVDTLLPEEEPQKLSAKPVQPLTARVLVSLAAGWLLRASAAQNPVHATVRA